MLIGSSHIAGSPFFKNFVPGAMDARRSRLIRPASTGNEEVSFELYPPLRSISISFPVICCAGAPTLLHIEPRDDFGNNCVFDVNDDPIKVC